MRNIVIAVGLVLIGFVLIVGCQTATSTATTTTCSSTSSSSTTTTTAAATGLKITNISPYVIGQ